MSTYDFGPRLQELRERAGLSQRQLGEQLSTVSKGLSAITTIARYEQGRLMPSMARLEQLAKVLGVDASELLRPVGSRVRSVHKKRGR